MSLQNKLAAAKVAKKLIDKGYTGKSIEKHLGCSGGGALANGWAVMRGLPSGRNALKLLELGSKPESEISEILAKPMTGKVKSLKIKGIAELNVKLDRILELLENGKVSNQ